MLKFLKYLGWPAGFAALLVSLWGIMQHPNILLESLPVFIQGWAIFLSLILMNRYVKSYSVKVGIMIEIIPSCVAGAAFFLLLFLILSTAEIKPKKRTLIIVLSMLILFILNILRIIILAGLAKTSYFEVAHWTSWHIISTLFVVVIWFAMVKIYKIKSIPVYSDLVFIQGLVKKRKKSKRSKKHK